MVTPDPIPSVGIIAVVFPTLRSEHFGSVFSHQPGIDHGQVGAVNFQPVIQFDLQGLNQGAENLVDVFQPFFASPSFLFLFYFVLSLWSSFWDSL